MEHMIEALRAWARGADDPTTYDALWAAWDEAYLAWAGTEVPADLRETVRGALILAVR